MPVTVFAVPVLPGKTDAWKAAVEEVNGPRKEEYIQARRSLGITKEVACLQQTPHGDVVVVYIEANDTSRILQAMLEATGPFDRWFQQSVLLNCHGIDASQPPPPANEVSVNIL